MGIRKKILTFLESNENATIREIASALNSDIQTIRTEIDKLTIVGLVSIAIEEKIVYSAK